MRRNQLQPIQEEAVSANVIQPSITIAERLPSKLEESSLLYDQQLSSSTPFPYPLHRGHHHPHHRPERGISGPGEARAPRSIFFSPPVSPSSPSWIGGYSRTMYQDEASSYALSSGEDSTGEGASQDYTASEGGQSYYTQTGEGSSTDMSKYVKSQR